MMGDDGHRGPQVCKLIGISYRQMDYWVRTGLMRPSIASAHGSGTQRRWSDADVRQLVIIKRLLDAGVSLTSIREALPSVRAVERGFLVLGAGRPRVVDEAGLLDALRGSVATVVDLAVENPTSSQGCGPIAAQGGPATVAP